MVDCQEVGVEGNGAFASKLICADCGGFYGQKVWHSTDRYWRVVYQCNAKFKNEKKCSTPHLEETRIQEMFLKAYDQLMGDREGVIADCEAMRAMLCDCKELDMEIRDLDAVTAGIAGRIQICILKTRLRRRIRRSTRADTTRWSQGMRKPRNGGMPRWRKGRSCGNGTRRCGFSLKRSANSR